MEQSRSRIISIAKEAAHATVEVDSAVFCARCASGKGCGAGLFGSDRGPQRIDALVAGHLALQEGDDVRIELAPQSVLRAAFIVYGVPLATALIVAGIAWQAGVPEAATIAAVVTGLALGALISRRWLARRSCLRQFTPVIVGRMARAE